MSKEILRKLEAQAMRKYVLTKQLLFISILIWITSIACIIATDIHLGWAVFGTLMMLVVVAWISDAHTDAKRDLFYITDDVKWL